MREGCHTPLWIGRPGSFLTGENLSELRTAGKRSVRGVVSVKTRTPYQARTESRSPPRPLGRLTAQEARVAALVAAGATNREAAEQLVLSPRTVDAHMRNILRKLELTSRKSLRNLR
jgi:DNA-binding NarL/FixJ family response regulator